MDTDDTVFFDSVNLRVETQGAELVVVEKTSEAVDQSAPLVGDIATGVDVDPTISTFLEGNNVSSAGGARCSPDLDGGRRSGEGGENAESEGGKVPGEHPGNTGIGMGGTGARLKH